MRHLQTLESKTDTSCGSVSSDAEADCNLESLVDEGQVDPSVSDLPSFISSLRHNIELLKTALVSAGVDIDNDNAHEQLPNPDCECQIGTTSGCCSLAGNDSNIPLPDKDKNRRKRTVCDEDTQFDSNHGSKRRRLFSHLETEDKKGRKRKFCDANPKFSDSPRDSKRRRLLDDEGREEQKRKFRDVVCGTEPGTSSGKRGRRRLLDDLDYCKKIWQSCDKEVKPVAPKIIPIERKKRTANSMRINLLKSNAMNAWAADKTDGCCKKKCFLGWKVPSLKDVCGDFIDKKDIIG